MARTVKLKNESPTVKFKIPGKSMGKAGYRTSVRKDVFHIFYGCGLAKSLFHIKDFDSKFLSHRNSHR